MRSLRSFIIALGRFLNGSATAEEKEVIDKWYSSLDGENNYPKLKSSDAEALHQKDFEEIQARIKRHKTRVLPLWPSLAAAAAVVLGIVYVYYVTNDVGQNTDLVINARTVIQPEGRFYNATPEAREIWLTDSSRIILQPESSISVAKTFNQVERDIVLEGEAFFEVKRNEKKPFNVFSYGVITKVLGTSFVIKAPSRKEKITVVVKTGKVSVSSEETSSKSRQRKTEIILTPNQQVTFDPHEASLVASLVDKPLPLLNPVKIRNQYDEEPISNILSDIEKLYGVEISYDANILRNCRITTAFKNEGLDLRMDILMKAIGGTYTVEGTQIFVHSNGCQIK